MSLLCSVVFLGMGIVYAVVTPPWQAPDEPTHLEYVLVASQQAFSQWPHEPLPGLQQRILGSMRRFGFYEYVGKTAPPLDLASFWEDPFLAEAPTKMHTPPGYYYLCGAVLRVLGVSEPLAALMLVRLLGILLGAATVFLITQAAFLVYQGRELPTILAGLGPGFIPQFLTIHASANSDALTVFVFTAFFAVALAGLSKRRDGSKPGTMAALVGLVLLGLVVKRTVLLLVPMVVLYYLMGQKREKGKLLPLTLRVSLYGLATLVLVYVLTLFIPALSPIERGVNEMFDALMRVFSGDFLQLKGRLAALRHAFLEAALFKPGWMRFSAPQWWYGAWWMLWLGSVVGLIVWWRRRVPAQDNQDPEWTGIPFVSAFLPLLLGAILLRSFSRDWAIQGRYLYPGVLPISLLFAQGWQQLLQSRRAGYAVLMAVMATLSLWGAWRTTTLFYDEAYPGFAEDVAEEELQNAASIKLDLGTPTARRWLVGEFFADAGTPGTEYVWMKQDAGIRFPGGLSDGNWTLELRVLGYPLPPPTNVLSIEWAGEQLGAVPVENAWTTLRFALRSKGQSGGNILRFKALKAASPSSLGRSTDPRRLSFAIDWVQWERAAESRDVSVKYSLPRPIPRFGWESLLHRVTWGRPGLWGDAGAVVFLIFGGLSVYLAGIVAVFAVAHKGQESSHA